MRTLTLGGYIWMTLMFGFSAVLSGHAVFAAADAGKPDDWALLRTIIYLALVTITLTATIRTIQKGR